MLTAMLMLTAGVPLADVRAEFLRSPDVEAADFDTLIEYLEREFPAAEAHGTSFPAVYRFATEALELDPVYIQALQERFAAA